MRLALSTALAFAAAATPVSAQDGVLERGRYLSQIMDCGGCHTEGALIGQPDPKLELAGSTIGFERRFNPALQFSSKADFVRFVLADLPPQPEMFAEHRRQNLGQV